MYAQPFDAFLHGIFFTEVSTFGKSKNETLCCLTRCDRTSLNSSNFSSHIGHCTSHLRFGTTVFASSSILEN